MLGGRAERRRKEGDCRQTIARRDGTSLLAENDNDDEAAKSFLVNVNGNGSIKTNDVGRSINDVDDDDDDDDDEDDDDNGNG